jgi:hypothetical protein
VITEDVFTVKQLFVLPVAVPFKVSVFEPMLSLPEINDNVPPTVTEALIVTPLVLFIVSPENVGTTVPDIVCAVNPEKITVLVLPV